VRRGSVGAVSDSAYTLTSTPLPCVHDRIPCQSTAHVDVASHLTASMPLSRVYCRILCQSTGHLYHRSMSGLPLHCWRRVTHDCVRADRCVYCRIPCQSTDRLYHNCRRNTQVDRYVHSMYQTCWCICGRSTSTYFSSLLFQTNVAHYFTKSTQTC